jgi:hypothetical protein
VNGIHEVSGSIPLGSTIISTPTLRALAPVRTRCSHLHHFPLRAAATPTLRALAPVRTRCSHLHQGTDQTTQSQDVAIAEWRRRDDERPAFLQRMLRRKSAGPRG